ncbi:hypothetical protein [Bacillus sp. REN10]|uniref:hypothetical protein n=1 Tax=Bacillus sp. REN10 TaxID=2782541 RepID=UPI00193BFF70|nr:hypothetical protein [Bacillus sp. REN10]
MNRSTLNKPKKVERIFAEPKLAFHEVFDSLINHKIEELVNNANKVNTATSQINKKESDVS